MVSIKEIALKLGMDSEYVRRVIFESHSVSVDRDTKDLIYQTARDLGYDITKLNISKKMEARLMALEEVLKYVAANPDWGRREIIAYIKYSVGLVERVRKKVLPEAFKLNKTTQKKGRKKAVRKKAKKAVKKSTKKKKAAKKTTKKAANKKVAKKSIKKAAKKKVQRKTKKK